MDEFAKKCCRRDIFRQTGATRKAFARTLPFWLWVGVLLIGCRSPHTLTGPTIEFTKIPVSAVGGLDNMHTIERTVIGVRPEQPTVFTSTSARPSALHPSPRTPFF